MWLSRTAALEVVKLLDFGLVRQADGVKTTTGFLLATPAYLWPEQILGAPIRSPSDLYSVGVLLFETRSGTRPWRREVSR